FIFIFKQSHRDVSKFLYEKTKNKSQDASTNFKEKRKQNKVKKEAKARVKAEKKAEQQAAQKEVKDVSDLPEISNTKAEQQSVIPIYGHSDNEEENLQSQQHSKYQRSKRKFNQKDGNSQTQRSSKQEQDSLDQLIDQTEQPTQDENANSISEAGEVENEAYTIPPLSLLNQPAKQKTTSKAEVQKKGQLLETTLKNFGVDAR